MFFSAITLKLYIVYISKDFTTKTYHYHTIVFKKDSFSEIKWITIEQFYEKFLIKVLPWQGGFETEDVI